MLFVLCSNKFAFHGSTLNLRDHYKEAILPSMFMPKIDSEMKVQKVSPAQTKTLDNLIIGLTIHNLRPAQRVERLGFQQLIEYCEPGYTVPSRKHISTLMFDRYANGKALLANKLQSNAFSLSLTTDIWSSSSMEAYISLTCHFLTSEWEIVDCVLATRSFSDHHMGENT